MKLLDSVKPKRVLALSTKGRNNYSDHPFEEGDALMFGPETGHSHGDFRVVTKDQVLRLPMLPDSRSLNLSNTVAIMVYETWRQMSFSSGR